MIGGIIFENIITRIAKREILRRGRGKELKGKRMMGKGKEKMTERKNSEETISLPTGGSVGHAGRRSIFAPNALTKRKMRFS